MSKLDTFEGVFIPTTLNVLSILIYLRFGFIVGQGGILGSCLLLLIGYSLNFITTLSLSAIATNGSVKGGGAYYMISRNLGPEFGGSIGIIFYVGQVLNAGLNVAGFADPLVANFGQSNGRFLSLFPDSALWQFAYKTILLMLCTVVCLLGPQSFARSSKLLFYVLLVATLAIPVSVFTVKPFFSETYSAWYTGPRWSTVQQNLWPYFTKGAVGSESPKEESLRTLFGVVFSAISGVLAGASMSGDLADPSKSIPIGTLHGLSLTFVLYLLVILALGSSVSREFLWSDIDIISDISISPPLVMVGEFSTSIFSILMGVFGAAKLLQAVAADNIVPLVGFFKKEDVTGTIPRRAIIATYFLVQLTILLPINSIAVYITMAILMTFVVLNVACFLLRIASAPNFRPSFRYFNTESAFSGFVSCLLTMFMTDFQAALSMTLIAFILFGVIHYYSEPKMWGDVSQAIIYHQVRKYLFKLKQDHVKYWRPQILLLVDDPRSGWQLIRFCNFLKKGGLFILGHVIISSESFDMTFAEIQKQRSTWEKVCEFHHIKAFFQICCSSSVVKGVRNIFIGSGLGGMRPNITVLGFYDENEAGQHREFVDIEEFPTNRFRRERHLQCNQWVQIIEDQITMGSSVCVAKGFMDIDLPMKCPRFQFKRPTLSPQYIDLYPIQLNGQKANTEDSVSFDTYTLILQLGAILKSVDAWKYTHNLRVIIFVELESEIPRETERIHRVLVSLRIDAEVIVKCLERGNSAYDIILKGYPDTDNKVGKVLDGYEWWDLMRRRSRSKSIPTNKRKASRGALQVTPSDYSNNAIADSRLTGPLSQTSTQKVYSLINKSNIGPHFQDDAIDMPQFVGSQDPENDEEHDQDQDQDQDNEPQPELVNLTFNTLPGSAQNLIINNLIRSTSSDATVIFTTLPPPIKNTYQSEENAREYYNSLRILCHALPPIAMVNAQCVTVTTEL